MQLSLMEILEANKLLTEINRKILNNTLVTMKGRLSNRIIFKEWLKIVAVSNLNLWNIDLGNIQATK